MPTDTAPIQTTATVITSGAEAIRTAREFAASIADGVIERDRSGPVPVRTRRAAGQLSRNFARRGLAAAWDGVRHRRGPTGGPRPEDVLAVLECTVEHALPGGDHEIIVGRVRHAETSANPHGPLAFFRGSYASLTDQVLPACG